MKRQDEEFRETRRAVANSRLAEFRWQSWRLAILASQGLVEKMAAIDLDAIVLGLTATPCRGDGQGLGGIFSTMIECPQIPELIEGGYLVKTRVYAPVAPDLRGVQTRSGDNVESQLAATQHGADLETIRRGLSGDGRGVASGPLGRTLDLIVEHEAGAARAGVSP